MGIRTCCAATITVSGHHRLRVWRRVVHFNPSHFLLCLHLGWVFEPSNGRLKRALNFNGPPNAGHGCAAPLDPERFSLTPVRVETFHGLLFGASHSPSSSSLEMNVSLMHNVILVRSVVWCVQ